MTVLAKDEQIIEQKQFTTNLVLAWLKTDFTLTSKRIIGFEPNTFMGLIPFGKSEVTYPLKNIVSVGVSTQFYFKRFFFGLIFAIIGLNVIGHSFLGGLILLLIGLLPLLNCFTAIIGYTNSAGNTTYIEMSILEKQKAEDFVSKINTSVAEAM